ncbi:secretory phospholipase A2 receptor-like [Salarias fasciatus]|nr:secretory phospholipase A2 receptor-like [Salarias fasciatus]XP_029942544.1 secretory phospholipase A2 receptor-like [Salarias fasciatus]
MQNLLLQILMGHFFFVMGQVHQYEFIDTTKSWEEAQKYCRSNYTDLATVPNVKFMKKLQNTINGTAGGEAWIGLYNKPQPTQTWRWSQPEMEMDAVPWATDEPNNKEGPENCGFISDKVLVGDIKCSSKRKFVCYDEKQQGHDKFYFSDIEVKWEDAQNECRNRSINSELVSGNTQLDEIKIYPGINFTESESKYWIGLFQDTWRWSDNSNSSYRNWKTFCENDNPEKKCDETCAAVILEEKTGKWTQTDCSKAQPFFCYKDNTILQKDEKSWDEAFRYCRKKHSDLVSIVSLEDQSWIQEKVKNASTEYVWLGLQYSCSLDLWFWLNDMISEEDLFEEGRPECDTVVAMSKEGKYKMVRKSENKKYNFICSLNYSDTGQGLSFYGLQCAKDDEDAALKYP